MPVADRLALALETQALALPAQGRVLVLRALPSPALELIGPARLVAEQSFRPIYDALAAQGYAVTARATGPAAMVLVLLTRARAENLGNIARGLGLLEPGATLAVSGAKTDGVEALARQVAAALPVDGQFSKAHGRVFWLRRPATLPAVVAEWAAQAEPRKNAEGFVTAPGMFAPDRADPGSRQLAEALGGGPLAGRVADLGAGWGWLAYQALAREPGIGQIDLYEAEAQALEAARLNLGGDPRAAFHWRDVAALAPSDGPYDAVITNPPFHQGRAADAALGESFIAAAARILKPSGRLLLVANRQLPYEAALDARFHHWDRLSEGGAYKVIVAERPQRQRKRA